ncbi:MAG: DUF5684 domain-containing protein [Lachnospiraceae bacterium]|jgi:hypothetical protein|nr:DUF5684 domain-containing protein [Lachnospiraceae bacterium]
MSFSPLISDPFLPGIKHFLYSLSMPKLGITILLTILVSYLVNSLIYYRIFKKTNQTPSVGWIPIYNEYQLCQGVIGNGWIFLLSFIPYVQIVYNLYLGYKIAKAFNYKSDFAMILSAIFPWWSLLIMAVKNENTYTTVEQFPLNDIKNHIF